LTGSIPLQLRWCTWMETQMARRFARTGFAALAVAGMFMAGSGTLAQAQVKPQIAYGQEDVTTYYNNAAHSEVVGVHYLGTCVPAGSSWGTFSAYYTFEEYSCGGPIGNPPPG
jgi:hypothetical protein